MCYDNPIENNTFFCVNGGILCKQKFDMGGGQVKKLQFAVILAILGFSSLFIGVSYAIFNTVLESNKDQVIKVGSIALRFTEENGGIELLNLEELTDEEGIASDNYYSFSIENVGSNDAYYEIKLIDDPTKTNTLSANYVRANVEVDGTSKPAVNIETSGRVIYQDTITAGTTKNYKLRIWLNFGSLTTEEKQALLNQEAYFKIKIVASQIVEKNLDTSNANKPELATGMIPVYYDETAGVWKKANSNNSDETNKWYDYDNKMWANVVTVSSTNRATYLSASVGTSISMDDINTMWVWIPRFTATGDTANYNGGTQSAPGAFDITFVDNKTSAHDAFTFGTQELDGFWVGKFETGGYVACSNETCDIKDLVIKPNVSSLINHKVSNYFYLGRSMEQSGNIYGFDTGIDTTLDTHMMKNNEWGAVAYLTQSIYGRCTSSASCTELGINSYSLFITGCGPQSSGSKSSGSTCNEYNSSLGVEASTTGNIYGIYDMSGGSFEYVMGVYTDGTQNWSGNDSSINSGFSGCLGEGCSGTYSGLAYPESKYYNNYTTSTNYTSEKLQHALVETEGWYNVDAVFVDGNYPWIIRGGYYRGDSYAGIFYYDKLDGYDGDNTMSGGGGGCRSVLIK